MRLSDEDLKQIEAERLAQWDTSAVDVTSLLLDLQDARAAIKSYVDWCDNKAGPNVIPYEVLDNLRKCVETTPPSSGASA